MSISSSLLCISGLNKEAVLAALDLRDTGEPALAGATEFAGVALADGGYVLALRGFMHPILHPRSLEVLSGEATVVACAQMESTNTSMACQVRKGKRVWEVSHILDEGPAHLDVKGRAPKALEGLLAAAVAENAKDGHDAVFGVPVALAHKAAGIAPGLRYTRLELVSDDMFASHSCLWRGFRQLEEAERFEKEQPDLLAALAPRLANVLAPLGFEPSTKPGVKHGFTRTVGELMQQVRVISSGHGRLDVLFEADHALIGRAIYEYQPTLETWGDLPYGLTLGNLEGRAGPYEVHNAPALEAFSALLEARLPHHAEALADLRALDRAMARTYAGRPLVNYLLKRRYQLLTGAWLTGNPDLPAMLEASAPTEERRAQCEGLLAMLKEKYQPLP